MLRFRGTLAQLTEQDRRALFERGSRVDETVRLQVAATIDVVRADGDSAIRALTRELDGVAADRLQVPRDACTQALDALDAALRAALERLAANLRTVHRAAMPASWEVPVEPGVHVGRRADPLRRVGIYAPGGRAAYASSLLMAAVPARVAGVEEVVVCSPPGKGGLPSPVVLAAAALAEVDELFAIGGAQAVAALAIGTESIRRVDRIVGPGNAYVTEAKLQLSGEVGIDAPAGPSEIAVVADGSADPRRIAAELVAQCEHDPAACAVAIVTDDVLAAELEPALEEAIEALRRSRVVRDALRANGGVLIADDLNEAVEFVDRYAPEHLLLLVDEPESLVSSFRTAGTVVYGAGGSIAFADYLTGANHVLPTGGSARAFSGLSTLDFMRWTSYQRIEPQGAAALRDDTVRLAASEGFDGHARAARRAASP